MPAGIEFQGNMVSGGIQVEDLRSQVDVSTVAGDIFVSSSEMVWANSRITSYNVCYTKLLRASPGRREATSEAVTS